MMGDEGTSKTLATKEKLESCQRELAKTLKQLANAERKRDKTQNYNKQLIEELEELKKTLHKERLKREPVHLRRKSSQSVETIEQEIQTDYAEYYHMVQTPDEQTHNMQVESSEPVYEPLTADPSTEEGLSIADQIRSAAEQAINQSDYVFDEASGMYYDQQTGYYYNPENKLYYDSTTYTYYSLNEKSGQYEYHSQADMSQYEEYYKHMAAKQQKEARRAAKLAKRESREQKHALRLAKNKSNREEEKNLTSQVSKSTSHNKERKKRRHTKNEKDSGSKKRLLHKRKSASQYDLDHDTPLTIDLSAEGGEAKKCSTISSDNVKVVTIVESDEGEVLSDEGEVLSDKGEVLSLSGDHAEDGEITSSDSNQDEELSSLSEDDPKPEMFWRPPCIRAIVQQSDSLLENTLHIITITGGNIGSTDDSTICIPEEKVNQCHCKISYSETERCYFLVELGSEHGTFVNSVRLSRKSESASIRLRNGDSVTIASTEFLLHIHPGTDTCSSCEPGVIQSQNAQNMKVLAVGGSKADVEKERRKQLKSLKSKYGLEREHYKDTVVKLQAGYEDKAESRRQKFGIDIPHVRDDAPASVDEAISNTNKGHKLLQKMGWKSGESLGKSQAGIVEPIKVDLRLNTSAGLGSMGNKTISMNDGGQLPKARQKAEILLKTQKRFSQAETNHVFNQIDDEDEEAVAESDRNVVRNKR